MEIKRAYLYGGIEEHTYIHLPNEDPASLWGCVGQFVNAMYGTQSAPLIWQKLCKRIMESNGFKSCITSPCCYLHPERDIRVVTHVDDLLVSGEQEHLIWFRDQLSLEFELVNLILGPGIDVYLEIGC